MYLPFRGNKLWFKHGQSFIMLKNIRFRRKLQGEAPVPVFKTTKVLYDVYRFLK